MSIVKIDKVRNLKRTVNYLLQDHKTHGFLYTSHECSPDTIVKDFQYITDLYNEKNNANKKMSSRMIVQSFDPNEKITPEQAHQYGVEYAKNYLNNEHQFLVVTHIDANHLHNHIVFNNINYKNLTMFNSKRSNSLYRLRHENDKISEKYGLKIIEKTREQSKYLSFNEYVARSKGTSFKARIENDIDDCILRSNTYDEFLEKMKQKGYEYKQGKYLSFKHPNSKKFIRTKTLGINYTERSIIFRINHKDYVPLKPNIINREWIDKTQDKFKNNKGLRRWATLQNINYINEINNILYKENITLDQLQELDKQRKNLVASFEQSLNKLDDEIYKLEQIKNCFDDYRNSHAMIIEYKNLRTTEEKVQFKKENFTRFKKYDVAKKNLNLLKKIYNINDKESLELKIKSLKKERDILYESLNINREQEKSINDEKLERTDDFER
jgi:hypothetical protein